MKKIDSIVLSGKESLPLVEGGKGIAVVVVKVPGLGQKPEVWEPFQV